MKLFHFNKQKSCHCEESKWPTRNMLYSFTTSGPIHWSSLPIPLSSPYFCRIETGGWIPAICFEGLKEITSSACRHHLSVAMYTFLLPYKVTPVHWSFTFTSCSEERSHPSMQFHLNQITKNPHLYRSQKGLTKSREGLSLLLRFASILPVL